MQTKDNMETLVVISEPRGQAGNLKYKDQIEKITSLDEFNKQIQKGTYKKIIFSDRENKWIPENQQIEVIV